MLRDITLGQYFPGDTVVHRLDPRTKLIMVVVYLVGVFSSGSAVTLGIMAGFLGLVVYLSKTKVCLLVRGLRPLAIILVFTGSINIFLTPGEPIFQVWILTATYEGLRHASVLLARIGLMVMGTFILTYTTSPMNLTDGLEMLLGPLKRLRVPVHELAMIMNMALRFVPTLLEETDKIMSAQKARGADFESGNILRRGKAMIPLLIPLFMSAFRRADELAVAMESRCYHGGEGRTRMRQLQLELRDALAGLVGLLLLGGIITLGVLGV